MAIPGNAEYEVPHGRQQTVLAVLLLEANRVVSIGHLIDAIWEDDPPATARTQVQICVSKLRNSLVEHGLGETIVTKPPGYQLNVAPGQLDARVFAESVGAADALSREGKPAQAAEVLARALALWRGPALSGVRGRIPEAKAIQLDESRLSAIETRVDIELRLGRHHQLVGELSTLVAEQPLRERLRGQLMLALFRAGRQAEALETYRLGRELMIDELGLEPGEELRRLETAILAGEVADVEAADALAKPPPARPEEADVPVPFQLPADVADFTGRAELVARAERLLLGPDGRHATRVVVLLGKPGVGKSALAVHVAHRLGDAHFPDGQLYCDLGGHRDQPTRAVDALGRFLRALGVPGEVIPEHADERAEMFRHLLARRRMFVLLDDAADEAQVTPLLPGSGKCVVLVTSRARLTGVAGAQALDVEVFGHDEAIGMLSSVIGPRRVAAEPAAADALVRLVGRLPLALRIVAARLGARPHWTLAWMLERLSDERRRLDELAHGQLMVRASLALTFDGLPPQARKLLGLLGLLDTPSFPSWVAAALLDADYLAAADLLELLVDAQMVEVAALDVTGGPRYKLHGLIRLFAREQLEHAEHADLRNAAAGRVAGGWLALAEAAHARVYGGDFTVLHGTAERWRQPPSYAARALADPLGWLESEQENLCGAVALTAECSLDELCWDLAVTLVTLFEARCYFEDWERTHRLALDVARAKGNSRGTAALSCSLGSLYLSRGRLSSAEAELEPALREFELLADTHGLAMVRRNLALLHKARGDAGGALERFAQALTGFRAVRDLIGQAHVLGQIAQIELDRGGLREARTHLDDALAICREVGNRRVEVQIRYRLAELMMHDGQCEQARQTLVELLRAVREGGDVVGEARILRRLGQVNARLGHPDIAEQLLAEALGVCEQTIDRAGADDIRADLAELTARSAG
ncbi:BTAD domain-containing putative transcriptional regulator [Amycolatopsis sp. NPDC051128]|uniref:AfsR/SARP family transcriptional regulator n=1 Tax=Amycolatopsis sp. NPDC051128 TaxID=3155412 RepID=UPI003424592E